MTKKNGTKRSLLMSALALVLCLSMLVGSTFAWFTDSVTSSGNIIKSGTLDVDIVTADGLTSLEGSNLKFQDLNGTTDILWEPGATFRTQAFKIENKGTLALKYRLMLNGVEGNAELLDVITFSIVDVNGATVDLSNFENDLAANTLSGEYYIQGVMSTAAGNEYQGKTLEGIGVTVIATQKDAENDAFGNTYDKDATYPANIVTSVAAPAVNAMNNTTTETTISYTDDTSSVSKVDVVVPAGTKLDEGTTELTLTIKEKAEVDDSASAHVKSDDRAVSYDINVAGVHADNEAGITVTMTIATGLSNVRLYHYGDEIEDKNYDPASGELTFTTTEFSPYTVVYDAPSDAPVAKVTVLGAEDTVTNSEGDVTVVSANRTIDTTGSKMGMALGEIPLDAAYKFEPTESYEQAQNSPYRYWHADFVVYADEDVAANSIALAGYYDAWCSLNNDKWVALTNDGFGIPAQQEVRLVEGMGNGGIFVNYEELCQYGNDGIGFLCGVKDMDNNAGTTITVELRLYETEEPSAENGNSHNVETGKYITICTTRYTFN